MSAPAEFRSFVESEYRRVVGAVDLVLGGEHAVAEELAQEAFLRASARWERVADLDSPGGWVAHVALNLARSQLRRRRAERRARARIRPEVAVLPTTDDHVSVHGALLRLPQHQREVVVLRYLLGYSAVEVAELVGARPDAVRKTSSRALATLRSELGSDLTEEVHRA